MTATARLALQLALLLALSAALPLAAPDARAQGFEQLGFDNRSDHDRLVDEPLRVREFATEGGFTVPPTLAGDTAFFEHRLAWMAAHRVEPNLPFTVLSFGNTVAYELSFTVADPAARGYTLDISSVLRGYVSARWDGNQGLFPSTVFATGTLMAAALDSGAGFVRLTELDTATRVAIATDATPSVHLLVERAGQHAAGSFVGTRSFTLRYSTLVDNTDAALQNLNHGEANVRFGLAATSPRFVDAGYPGLDGEAAHLHGHFVGVSVVYAPVPEPAVALLLAGGLAALRLARRGRRGCTA